MPKRWEFGSQIHWLRFSPSHDEVPRPWEPSGVLTGSGRDALRLVLQQQRWKRLWVPSYLCQEVPRSLLRSSVELACFADSPLDPAPDLSGIPLCEGDAVLIVNYFGLRRAEDIKIPGFVGVIEDHTHGPCSRWARESKADYCISSLRKIFPLPDGGVAWSPKGHALPALTQATSELEAASTVRLSAMLLKALYLEGHPVEKHSFLDLSTLGEDRFDTGPISAMTSLSMQLLSTLPLQQWETIRRANFWRFADALAVGHGFQVLAPRDTQETPFCVAVVFDDPEVRSRVQTRLIQKAIYPSALWPLDQPVLGDVPDANRILSQRMFTLPCDARYNVDDVKGVIDALREEGLLSDARGREIQAVPKEPLKKEPFTLRRIFTTAARAAFEHLLRHGCPPGQRILLPAYVGLSPRKVSGVYDPIQACALPCAFYRVGASLQADLSDLQRLLREAPSFAVLAIHYFGFPQPEIMAIRELCDRHRVLLIEDCAHTFDSGIGNHKLGTIGDASLFSIHKILPTGDGGILQINNPSVYVPPQAEVTSCSESTLMTFCNADWKGIAGRRRSNYRDLAKLLRPVRNVTLMFPELNDGVTPMNLPVLIERADRSCVHRKMREEGIEVVAQYDTLIDPILPDEFPLSHHISRRILNLPVHQDVEPEQLDRIARTLDRAVNG